jgi:methyl-accepting chemotaxis protein
MQFSNIKIVYKVVALLAALGAVSIFAAVFSTSKLSSTDAIYTDLTDNDYPSLVAIARANRFMSSAVGAAFEVVAFPDEASISTSKAAFASAHKTAVEQFDHAIASRPENAAPLRKLEADWKSISSIIEKAIDLGAANRNDEALKILGPLRGEVVELQKQVQALIDTTSKELETIGDDTRRKRRLVTKSSTLRSSAAWRSSLRAQFG